VIARGYHCRQEENAARFVTLPHLTEGPVFRTGDRVRRDAEGELYYVGRNDRQVKVRGVRIELDEVEAALTQSVGMGASCAVVARPSPSLDSEGAGELHVAAFVAPETIDVEAVRRALAAKLPATMMPAVITTLAALPLLPNGKTDRQALQSLTGTGSPSAPTGNVLQELILSIWARLLPSPPTSIESEFHLLGGDSLSLVEFVTQMESVLGRSISSSDIPHPLTAAAMARMLEQGAGVPAVDPGIEIVPVSGRHYNELLQLLIESFSLREPMAAALHAQPADLLPFARALLTRCESEPFSYVAIKPDSGRVVGFCLGHDFAGPALAFDTRTDSPKLTPLFDLLARLHRNYSESVQPREGRVFEIAATGAAPDADGYNIARALERTAIVDARARGFERVVSLCTNAVTRYLSVADQGGHLLQEIPYDTFEHEGRRVFADAAQHRGVALIEGYLA
jgi:acyl carrier protein